MIPSSRLHTISRKIHSLFSTRQHSHSHNCNKPSEESEFDQKTCSRSARSKPTRIHLLGQTPASKWSSSQYSASNYSGDDDDARSWVTVSYHSSTAGAAAFDEHEGKEAWWVQPEFNYGLHEPGSQEQAKEQTASTAANVRCNGKTLRYTFPSEDEDEERTESIAPKPSRQQDGAAKGSTKDRVSTTISRKKQSIPRIVITPPEEDTPPSFLSSSHQDRDEEDIRRLAMAELSHYFQRQKERELRQQQAWAASEVHELRLHRCVARCLLYLATGGGSA